MKQTEPDIKEFINYRMYLRSLYEFHKETRPRFSFQAFTDLLGLGNRSFIQNIVRGVKDLPLDRIPSICERLGLDHERQEYFELLVRFDEEQSALTKDQLWSQIRQSQSKVLSKTIEESQLAVFDRWHTVPVLELLGQGFSDPRLIGRRILPHVPVADVREDIKLLVNLRFVTQNEDGSYSQTNPVLVAARQKDLRAEMMRSYQAKMMDMAKEALTNIPPEERFIQTMAGTFSPANYAEIERRLRDLLNFCKEEGEKDQGPDSRVFQLNLGLFPMSIPKSQDPTDY